MSTQEKAADAALESTGLISTGDLGRKLGFDVRAEFLRSLGFTPVPQKGAGTYWRASDYSVICEKLIEHIMGRM